IGPSTINQSDIATTMAARGARPDGHQDAAPPGGWQGGLTTAAAQGRKFIPPTPVSVAAQIARLRCDDVAAPTRRTTPCRQSPQSIPSPRTARRSHARYGSDNP